MSEPQQTRYLDPDYCIGVRLGDRPRPRWPAALLLFRDHPTSHRLLGLFGGVRPVDYRLFYDLGNEGQQPTIFEADVAGRPVAIGTSCVWGGPQTAILVEELACLSVGHILGLGACGSLDAALSQGSLVLCDRALPTDGTSRAYGATEPLRASRDLVGATQMAASELGYTVTSATAATVDALYRETPALIWGLRRQGAQIVNLETSPLYAVSAACGVESLWVGCVSDCLTEQAWQHWYVDLRAATEQAGRLCKTVLERLLGGQAAP
jgi:uridine phosphorylase